MELDLTEAIDAGRVAAQEQVAREALDASYGWNGTDVIYVDTESIDAAVRAAAPIIERAVRERVAAEIEGQAFVERVADTTAGHHITDNQDADRNNICSCGEWADSADMEGWDEHMAHVAMGFVAAVITDA